MERERQEAVIEAVLFTMGESVSLHKLAELVEDTPSATRKIVYAMKEKWMHLTGVFPLWS